MVINELPFQRWFPVENIVLAGVWSATSKQSRDSVKLCLHPCTFFHEAKRALVALQLRLICISKNACLCVQNERFAADKRGYNSSNNRISLESQLSVLRLSREVLPCLNLQVLRFFLTYDLLSQWSPQNGENTWKFAWVMYFLAEKNIISDWIFLIHVDLCWFSIL